MGKRLRRLAPPTPALRTYALCAFVDATGTGLYGTGSVLFFTRRLHLSASFVGLALTVAALAGLVTSVPAGRFADRVGRAQVFVPSYLVLAVLFCALPAAGSRPVFVLLLSAIAAAQSGARPARKAALADLTGDTGLVAAAAYARVVENAGFGVGAALAAVALAIGSGATYDAMLVGDGISFAVAAALFTRLPLHRPEPRQRQGFSPRSAFRDGRYMLLAVSTGVLMMGEGLIDVGLPLQVTRHPAVPRWVVAAAVLLNITMVVLFQVRVSRGTERLRVAARSNVLAGFALLAGCLAFPLSSHRGAVVATALLLLSMALLTLGELWISAGQWGLSYGLAPPARRTEHLAAYGVPAQGLDVVAPLLAATVVTRGAAGFLGAGAVFVAAGLLAPAALPRAPRDASTE